MKKSKIAPVLKLSSEQLLMGNNQQLLDFLNQGGDVHIKNEKGQTLLNKLFIDTCFDKTSPLVVKPLDLKRFENLKEKSKILVNAGARLRTSDHRNLSPLHALVFSVLDASFSDEISKNSFASFVTWLLENGVNINAKNQQNQTPLMFFLSQMQTNLDDENLSSKLAWSKLFISPDLQVNVFDDTGQTYLHYLARLGVMDLIEDLMMRGANTRSWDRFGRLPVDLIREHHPDKLNIWTKLEDQTSFPQPLLVPSVSEVKVLP